MTSTQQTGRNNLGFVKKIAARGGIIAFFIMAFEVMIMISPFAFFFYSVFNPIFAWLDHYAATRWLTSFFLPHMVLPPTLPLKAIRIGGSILFVIGLIGFLICALQVYLGKIFKWGIAAKGLYAYIRHPQYLFLGVWGVGLVILWPRFIVLATLSLMFILYYFLAKDEEQRMLDQYGDDYRQYMEGTGMFVPFSVAGKFRFVTRWMPDSALKNVLIPVSIIAVVLGAGFLCRTLTVHSLPFATEKNLTLLPILPEDAKCSAKVLEGIIRDSALRRVGFIREDKNYLGYLMPADYVMQGMIADTGSRFHLFKQHHTIAMISDWVLHPFEHLRRPPSAHMAKMHNVDPNIARRHHCPLGIDDQNIKCGDCPYRRVIIVEIEDGQKSPVSGADVLGFNMNRIPAGFVDINTQTGEIINSKEVQKSTAWKDVPTPAI
ncbi:MAG TPA: isoprenylcysteine carboxylmethyltransferase family protein [Desulfomonilaceae bacterium]|nr:isoprenylcysteine carboxylmethyltransferase family protein [Desulfomonilaceae bacterium]